MPRRVSSSKLSQYRPSVGATATLSVLMLVVVLVQCYIVRYLHRLEQTGCQCAMDWRRTYAMWFVVVAIIINVANFCIMAGTGWTESLWTLGGTGVGTALSMLFFLGGVVFTVATLQYVSRLKREKCKCSESSARVVIEIVAWMNAFLYIILALLILAAVVLMATAP